MRVLLDTCVLSETQKKNPLEAVVRAVRLVREPDLFLSVITIGEIRKGVELLRASSRKTRLQEWLRVLEDSYRTNLLPITQETTHIWGTITAQAQKNGHTLSACDGLIAATAIQHGLSLMTRNVHDFECTGVVIRNPWDQ